jgi:hypothetical protein
MDGSSRWRDSRESGAGGGDRRGHQAFDAAVSAMLDDARGWRLGEMRMRRGMTQEQVAARTGVGGAGIADRRR